MTSHKVRILTDIAIPQSSVWRERTDFINDLFHDTVSPVGGFDGTWRLLRCLYRFVRTMRGYDVVITANFKLAQLVGLYRLVFRVRRPRQIMLELMLDEETRGLKWKLKLLFQRLLFSSVNLAFVSSTREVQSYASRLGIPAEKLRFLPFHTNVVSPGRVETDDGFVLSAGKTGRDFAVLAQALDGTGLRCVIVTDQYHLRGLDVPANVVVRTDIPYTEYFDLLHRAMLVVVPLKTLVKSTGQVVILEAMALGKPVVATRTVGTLDYIEDGVTGILVPQGNAAALRAAILTLASNPPERQRLSHHALDQVRRHHTFEAYVGQVLHAAEEQARQAVAEGRT